MISHFISSPVNPHLPTDSDWLELAEKIRNSSALPPLKLIRYIIVLLLCATVYYRRPNLYVITELSVSWRRQVREYCRTAAMVVGRPSPRTM